MKKQAYATETATLRALAKKAAADKRATKTTKQRAAACVKAANAVDAASKPIPEKARSLRIAERDTLGLTWEAAEDRRQGRRRCAPRATPKASEPAVT